MSSPSSPVLELELQERPPVDQVNLVSQSAPTPLWMLVSFGASGFAALIYQIVWQRVLFAAFGVNVEAVTVVVTAFLAGLGCGSFLGGWLAKAGSTALLRGFGTLEVSIGLFGVISLPFFRWIGELTVALDPVTRGAVTALIVMLPTTLMGATLPLLVGYLVRRTGNVGRAVGMLYFVNTAGSAVAALAAALVILRLLGESRSTLLAAAINLSIGALVFAYGIARGARR